MYRINNLIITTTGDYYFTPDKKYHKVKIMSYKQYKAWKNTKEHGTMYRNQITLR